MRLTRGHPSTAFSINFSGKAGQPTPRRRQDQSRPLLQLPQSAATKSKGTGSLFLRRKVASLTRDSVNNPSFPKRRYPPVAPGKPVDSFFWAPWTTRERNGLAGVDARCQVDQGLRPRRTTVQRDCAGHARDCDAKRGSAGRIRRPGFVAAEIGCWCHRRRPDRRS
jgi:hypothetical protein